MDQQKISSWSVLDLNLVVLRATLDNFYQFARSDCSQSRLWGLLLVADILYYID